MSAFGSKRKANVGVSVTPLIPTKQSFSKNAILRGIRSGDITGSILDESMGGFSFRAATQYFNKCKNNQYIGLPTGSIEDGNIDPEALRDIIQGLEFQTVTLEYFYIGNVDAMVAAQEYFQRNGGINLLNNNLILPPAGIPQNTYLHDAVWMENSGTIVADIREIGGGSSYIGQIVIDRVYPNGYYIYAYYEAGENKVFIYNTDDGLYPELGRDVFFTESSYLPIIQLRGNFFSTVRTSLPYQAYKKTLRVFGIDLDEMMDQIEDDTEENDPSLIKDVFFLFGLDIQNDTKQGIRYLSSYFKNIKENSLGSPTEFQNWQNQFQQNNKIPPPRSNLISVQFRQFKYWLEFIYIDVRTETGSIGPVGSYKSETIVREPFVSIISEVNSRKVNYDHSSLLLKRQISANQIEVVEVRGLLSHNEAYDSKHLVTRTLKDSVHMGSTDAEDGGFYIPLHRPTLLKMPGIQASYVCQDAMNITIYTLSIQKIKWYQRSGFSWLLNIVIAVVSIYSGNWQNLASLSFGELVRQIIIQVLKAIIVSQVLNIAVRILSDMFGLEFLVYLAAIVAMFTTYSMISGRGINGLPFADELMAVTTQTMNTTNKVIRDETFELIRQMEEFHLSHKERMDELRAEMEELNTGLDWAYITNFGMENVSWEDPSLFFTRTLDNNPGIHAFDMIASYVDNMLQLPKTNLYSNLNNHVENNEVFY